MRVLHFLPVYAPAWQFGGPVLSVSRLCEGLAEEGLHVRVITTNAGLPDLPPERLGTLQHINGVEVIYYPVDRQGGIIQSKALVDELPKQLLWADILHMSSIWQPLGLAVQNAAHSAEVPIIQTLRGALGPYSWRHGWWKKFPYFWIKERPLLKRVAALHCTTIQEAREIDWLGLNDRIRVIPNPIDLSQLSYNAQLGDDWRHKNAIPMKTPLFLVAGRLHHKKGLDLLPQVLQTIANRSWEIVFIGTDDDGTGCNLRALFKRFGLEDRCHWLEHVPANQLSGPYNAADCLLLPSRHENFGNVVVEALACGCGVLISDRVGVADSIRLCPGVTICPRSAHNWIAHLNTILATKRPGLLSANWVANSFSKSSVARQAEQLYASMVTHE